MAYTGATRSCLFSALHHLRFITPKAWLVQAAGSHPSWWRCAWPASTNAFCDVSCPVAQQRPPARLPQSWPERQRAPERSRSMRLGMDQLTSTCPDSRPSGRGIGHLCGVPRVCDPQVASDPAPTATSPDKPPLKPFARLLSRSDVLHAITPGGAFARPRSALVGSPVPKAQNLRNLSKSPP